ACCREDGADFGRVVSVIIDDDRAVRLPDIREAALDALETFEPGNDCIVQYAELDGDSDCRQSVLNIVAPGDRHMERKRSALAVAAENDGIELAAARDWNHIIGANIGQGREAEGDDAPVADAADDVLHLRVIHPQD